AARLLRVCWLKAGLTRCESCSRTDRYGHSGITNLNVGRRTKACDSITFCFHRRCRTDSWTAAWTDGCVARSTLATCASVDRPADLKPGATPFPCPRSPFPHEDEVHHPLRRARPFPLRSEQRVGVITLATLPMHKHF